MPLLSIYDEDNMKKVNRDTLKYKFEWLWKRMEGKL